MSDGAGSLAHVTAAGAGRRAFGDVLVQIVARVLNLALGVVVTAVVVRTLGDSGYGQWMTLLTSYQLVGYFTSLGLEAVAVRHAAAEPERAAEWVGALMVTRLALTVPVIAAALVVLLLIQESQAMLVAGLVLLLQFPFGVGSSLAVVHQLRVKNAVPMVILTINSVVWGVCVLAIHLAGGGLVALAVALTASTWLTATMQGFAAFRLLHFRLRPSRAMIGQLLRIGAPLGVSGLLIMAYARVDQVVVFEQAGAQGAGYYGAVYRILEQLHFIPVSVMTTLAPLIAASWPADRARTVRMIRQAAEFLTIGSLGALAFATVAADPLVRLFFGSEFAPAAHALPVLSGAFVFICFGYLTGNLMLVLGLVRYQIVIGVAGLIVNVAGNLLLVPRYGFMAAAWMTLATEVVVVAGGAFVVFRGLGATGRSLGRLGRVVAAAALLLGLLLAVEHAGGGLAILAMAAAVAYPALLLVLRAVVPQEIRSVVLRRGAASAA